VWKNLYQKFAALNIPVYIIVGVTSTVTQKRTRKQAQTIWNIICDSFPIRKHHLWYKNDTLSYNNKHGKEKVDVAGARERAWTRSSADTKVTNVDLQLIRLEDLNSCQQTNTNTSTSYSNAETYVEPTQQLEHEHVPELRAQSSKQHQYKHEAWSRTVLPSHLVN
jgi:hypothetical protein